MPKISFGTPLKGAKKAVSGGSEPRKPTPVPPKPANEGAKPPVKPPGRPVDGLSGGGKGKTSTRPAKALRAQPPAARVETPEAPEEKELRHVRLLESVADAADQEGMYSQDLLRFPELLLRHGIDPAVVTHGLAHRADQLNRQRINSLLDRYKKCKENYDAQDH